MAHRLLFLTVLLILATWAVGAHAVAPDKTTKADERLAQLSSPAKTEASPQQPERNITFQFRDKPWIGERGSVLEWLSDQTGLPVSTSSAKPTGTLTFISPTMDGAPKKYTLPEVIDILNGELFKLKLILVRRAKTFSVEPADETIDPAILPRVLPNELNHYGDTELVSVVFPLTALVAEDFANELKGMLGPFGKVQALAHANKVVVQDTVANLKRINAIVKDSEDTEKTQNAQFYHPCKYIKAREAERILKDLLGDPTELLRLTQPRPAFGGRGGGFGGPFGGPFGGQIPQQPAQAATAPKIRMHYISVDEQSNAVLVTGPADKIEQAKAIIKRIDVPAQEGQKPVLYGAPVLKTYSVPGGNAEALAKNLQEIYKAVPGIRISAVGSSSIMVYAGPGDQFEILEHIKGSKEQNGAPEVIPLTTLDATEVVDTLKGMFGGDGKSGGPYLKADTSRNAVVVKGTSDQMDEIRVALRALGEGGAPALGGTMRVINLDRGSAAAVAEELERMLPKLLQNPVQIITPGGNGNKSSESSNESKPQKSKAKDESGSSEEQEAPPVGTQFVDPQQPPAKNNQPAGKGPPVKITAIGNKLIISSDDPTALKTAQELVRFLTQPQAGQGDYEAIRLKNASATDAAKALDEAFNGPRQQAGPQQGGPGGGFGGFFGRFAAAGAAPPSTTNPNTIRVVAYPPTNTLLVRASPLDMLRIRQLLKNAIDTEDTDSKGVMRTFVLKPLKYADATEVANVIKDVYREYTNNNPVPGQVGGFPGFGFGRRGGSFQNANVDANGNPRGVGLSVGVDTQANRLIVNCTESLYEDIQKLVDNLDSSTKDSTRTIRVIPLQGVDPLLVQQAIDAIQGRRTTTATQSSNPFGTPGSGGFGRGGFGGFGGGMNPGMLRTPGGANTPGAGPAGGAGGGRPSTTPRSPQSRGPDFFGHRVKDDPEQPLLYDPQQPTTYSHSSRSGDGASSSRAIQLTSLEEQQPPAAPTTPDIRGPRAPVTAEALEQLGVIVISGNNPADVDEIIRIIDYIRRLGAGAEVQIQLVPLEHADATSVASILTQLFQRVVVTAAGNVRSTQPTTTTAQTPFGASTTTQAQAASVVLLPLPRFNAILMAAPKARVADILDEIKRLDRASSPQGRATSFPLKKASASRVATLLINWYNQRYPSEPATQNQVRITYEDSTNTVFVQAAPADLEEIRELIDRIDNTVSNAVNDLRIVPLRYALASDMATLMVQSISQGIVAPTAAVPTIAPTAAGPGALAPGVPRPTGALPGAPTAAPAPTAQTTGTTKTISLRFFSPRPGAPGAEAGILEDIHITPDVRTNSLILAAQSKTMELLLALIRDLDVPPPARAEVKVFPLQRSDASTTASILQQLLFGTGGPTAAAPAGVGGTAAAAAPLGATNVAGVPTTQYTISGAIPEGAPLVEVHITVDVRTNSLIVAAGRNEMDVIDAVIHRLEAGEPLKRENRVIHLRYGSAADVANALQGFLNNALTVVQRANQYTSFLEYERDVVVFAEPITNQLLVSASPQYFPEVMRLIDRLDIEAPQVVIQVLIAEVDLNNTEEFGVEVGLQSPVLFSRSVIPAQNFIGTGTINYTSATGGLVSPGVTVNSTINPTALQGFDFNNANSFGLPLGNNPVVSPGVVGFQGLSNLGVNRMSSSGIGGFVFSAASNTFNLLIRALKTQGRIDVLSRPQIQATDNQTALINIGQDVPYVTGSTVSSTGLVTNLVSYRSVGVIMQVTPRIGPDGTVIMRVIPEVSSVLPTSINLGNGQLATQFQVQHVETTISAKDGETVAIGGLIQKRDTKSENKYPWLGDLPYIGALFRYRSQVRNKTELLVILTPHIVRNPLDADRILAEEARRMDWVVGDVVKIQGTSGMAPILSPAPPPGQGGMHEEIPASPLSGVPCPSDLLPGPTVTEPPAQESLPQPRGVPQVRSPVSSQAPPVPAPTSPGRP
jgi:type II secretory pathway component GspD/PulD (secretin)